MNTYNMYSIKKLNIGDFENYKKHIQSTFSLYDFERFVSSLNDEHIVLCIVENDCIVGSGTLKIEPKLHHGYCKLAHLENVLIDDDKRGKGYGKMLVNTLIDTANELGCYKVSWMCNDNVESFYKKHVPNVQSCNGMYVLFSNNFT